MSQFSHSLHFLLFVFLKLVAILSNNCPVVTCCQCFTPWSKQWEPRQHFTGADSCRHHQLPPTRGLWQLNLEIARRAERGERRDQPLAGELGWHNESRDWELGRAELRLHRQLGWAPTTEIPREKERWSHRQPRAQDGELSGTGQISAGEGAEETLLNKYSLTHVVWHVASGASQDYFWNVWVLTSTELIFSTPDGFNMEQKHWRLKLDEQGGMCAVFQRLDRQLYLPHILKRISYQNSTRFLKTEYLTVQIRSKSHFDDSIIL